MNLLVLAIGYLIGSFPTGVIFSKRRFGIDVREIGSGNIGATNITRAFGWGAGVMVFLIDYFKGVLPLLAIRSISNDSWLVSFMGMGLVVGHCFSLYLKFRGGKGVATSLGVITVVSPVLAAVCGAVYVLVLILTKISALGSLSGIFLVVLYLLFFGPSAETKWLLLVISAVVVIRHQSNIRRLYSDFLKRREKVVAILFVLLWSGQASGGFSEDIDATFEAAKREKKPLMLHFYGIWCPPCNELEETVFESAAFQKRAEAFKLLRVDADKEASWKLKDKYKVGGYPTTIFTNAEGGEIYRVVGYREPRKFLEIMTLVLGAKKDLNQSCVSKDPGDLWRCALVCKERKDMDCAKKAFGKLEKSLKRGEVRYLVAQSFFVENEATEDLKRVGYERLLRETTTHPISILWAYDYTGLFEAGRQPELKRDLVENVLKNFDSFRNHADLAELGLPPSDLLQMRAELLARLGKSDDAKLAWKEASNHLETLARELPNTPARGFALERMSCLEEAGHSSEALKLATEYLLKFPEEFTFHFKAAHLLDKLRRPNEAIPVAKKAYEVSYGDNRIRAATLLIKLYTQSENREAAQKIYAEVTRDIKPDASLQIRTHRYLDQLKKAIEKTG